mmetsp:Transcript_13117/g.23047  ORF Transcript_13117/g.23047 Transcript_13117/m.23047 type:complete len:322 (-) Transcript_13117:1047-2012(-)
MVAYPGSCVGTPVWECALSVSVKLTLLKGTFVDKTVFSAHSSFAVHFARYKSAMIRRFRRQRTRPHTVWLIVLKLTFVTKTITVLNNPKTTALAVQEVAHIGTPVRVGNCAFSVLLAVQKRPFINRTVEVFEFSLSSTEVVYHISLVPGTIFPGHTLMPVLRPFSPFSDDGHSSRDQFASAVHQTVTKASCIHRTCGERHLALAVVAVVEKLAFVLLRGHSQYALSVALLVFEVSDINRAVFGHHGTMPDQRTIQKVSTIQTALLGVVIHPSAVFFVFDKVARVVATVGVGEDASAVLEIFDELSLIDRAICGNVASHPMS